MKPEEDTLSGDTTQLLRDILQSKDRKELENNNTIKSYCVVEDRENSEMISSMLRAKSNTSAANSDNDNWSVNADNYSVDDSDIDVDTEEQINNSEIATTQGSPEANDDIQNGLSGDTEQDSKEAKRARVENIITSMRPMSQINCDEINRSSPEIKRQKRKQYQPQQHDVKNFGDPETKYRKVERAALQEHIQQLQNQLRVVKQKCDDLCEDEQQLHSAHSDGLLHGYSENNEHLSHGCKIEKENCVKENGYDIIRNTCRNEWDPSHFIRQASKLVQEQEVLSKSSGKKTDTAQSPDIHALANSIKTEIVEAINKVVDNAVNKLLEKNTLPQNKVSDTITNGVSVDSVKETLSAAKLERKAEVTSSSLSEQSSEFRHSISSRLSDKISAFEPLHRNDNDFPRISVSNQSTLPFHHPFPYYLPAQVMGPMYATEPEQTEALPLIVSTPKKKRTKVTDTRLSPRAKSALLQDSFMPSQLSLDHDRPSMMSSFPHLFPPMLPTSVAIPNPSLTHSDIMSFGMREHNFWESRMMNQSPPHSDRVSPKSPADSYSSFRKSDIFDNSQDMNDGSHQGQ
ncbi:uncharacterized protein LOC130012897, partial [Patella vulgata]|uniref:uncharacterized protein LOC130012897 n=1 Tax=Patella vulgata TaxID=6465 RepID=UPI0024A88D4C